MQILSSSCALFHSISTILIILIIISSTSLCQEDEGLFNCYSHFSCGENFPNISYPFWGGNKNLECGFEEFHLTCQQDDHLDMHVDGQTFRVLSIDDTNRVLRIARSDLWDDVCPENNQNTSIVYEFLFTPGQDFRSITLFYSCPNVDLAPRNQFNCTNTSGNVRNGFFRPDESPVEGCESSISVPVLESALEEFRNNTTVTVQELLNQGFNAAYNLDNIATIARLGCERSGGQFRNGTNSTRPACLCGDGPHAFLCSAQGNSLNLGVKIIIGAMSAGGMGLLTCFLLCCLKFKKSSYANTLFLGRKTNEDRNLHALIMQHRSLAPKRYPYSDIKKMTNSFQDKLGQGGYGAVYKGKLLDGRLVAVKILNVAKGNGEEFINEVLSIIKTLHVNVVTLLGFCLEGKRRALVYEFMPNGSLEKYIHSKENCNQLGMDKLYQISLGVARGLEYLHRGCNTRILHFDIKPHNILLDEEFCPKISDFGLAQQCAKNDSTISMLGARGTIGYIAPELISRNFGRISYKSDVYSYGMMVMEIVGRRKNVNIEISHTSEIYFPHWAYQHLVIDKDLSLKGVETMEEDEIAKKIILVGLWCIQSDPSQRPTMSKVIEMLEGSLQALEIPPKPFFGSPSRSPQTSSVTIAMVS